ncbi:MAG: protein phosphatase CheZ [Desulfovibrionaceae bacterium]|nr:protein phosphatase CheZ [Desulfovibrionaceae bacterium]
MSDQSKEPIYKQLSNDMRAGLRDIYHQISSASAQDATKPSNDARALLLEATSQLDEVLKSTEEAASNILEIIERNELNQEEVGRILQQMKEDGGSEAKIARLESINQQLGEDLTNLTLQLSFQDLTGQRIKKVVSAINKIEDTVIKLYITSGLIMEGAENDQLKDATLLKAEAEQAVEEFKNNRVKSSELKGPDKNGMSQKSIDDMLNQLGL